MFKYCYNLTELDLSSFNTNKVDNMIKMFSNCNKLSKIYLSSFNTNNVNDMFGMFKIVKI